MKYAASTAKVNEQLIRYENKDKILKVTIVALKVHP
jgi:hypothetical protein